MHCAARPLRVSLPRKSHLRGDRDRGEPCTTRRPQGGRTAPAGTLGVYATNRWPRLCVGHVAHARAGPSPARLVFNEPREGRAWSWPERSAALRDATANSSLEARASPVAGRLRRPLIGVHGPVRRGSRMPRGRLSGSHFSSRRDHAVRGGSKRKQSKPRLPHAVRLCAANIVYIPHGGFAERIGHNKLRNAHDDFAMQRRPPAPDRRRVGVLSRVGMLIVAARGHLRDDLHSRGRVRHGNRRGLRL